MSGLEAIGQRAVRNLFGVPVNALTMAQVLDAVDDAIVRRGRLLIGMINAAKLVNMRRDESLRQAVLDSELILADGMSVVWASRILNRRLPERVAGIDLMNEMLRLGSQRNYRLYCLGAREEVMRTAVARIESDYAGVKVVGWRNGYFAAEEEEELVAKIRATKPDMLFVAMSPPKKEIFLSRWYKKLEVPVCHGVGGAIDVLAGEVRRAPDRWQRLGLEWLYRVVQEPRRMWKRYLVTNTVFCGMVLRELIKRTPVGLQEGSSEVQRSPEKL